MPTVLVVDDHEVVRHGLRHVIEQNPDAVVVVLTDRVTADEIVAATRDADEADAAALDAQEHRRRDVPQISAREQEVLELLAEGLGAAQIGRALFISESTTKTHISHLYAKLGAANRAQALMTALGLGLLERPARNPAERPRRRALRA